MNMMTVSLVSFALLGGVAIGVTVESRLEQKDSVSRTDIESAVTSALLRYDDEKRSRDKAEQDRQRSEAQALYEKAMRGWGDTGGRNK